MTAHPYMGIVHDARFYTVQALNFASNGGFNSDLFFAYGSQDRFTAFTGPYTVLVEAAGAGAAHVIASAIGQLLWLGALVWLLRRMFAEGSEWFAAAIGVVLLDRSYGASNVFTYAETFVTPRLYAEAMVLAAGALILSRRYLAAGAVLVIVGAIHPLIGATGVAVIAALILMRDKRAALLIGLGALIVLLLACSGLEPFGRVLRRFDPAWAGIVEQRSSYSFVASWGWLDWLRLAATAGTLAAFRSIANPRERRLATAVIMVALGGVLASYLGGDVARNVFAINLQPWRVLWIAAVFANAAVAVIVMRLPRGYISRDLFLVGGVLSAMVDIFWGPQFIAPCVLLLAAAALAWEWRVQRPLGRRLAAPTRIVAFMGLVIAGFIAVLQMKAPGGAAAFERLAVVGGALAAIPLLGFSSPIIFGAVIIGALSLQLWHIDKRSGWQKFVEDRQMSRSIADLPLGRNVYWESGLEFLWLKLNRPSYYSCGQGTGVMFYRETAMEYERRGRALRGLNTYDFRDAAEFRGPVNEFCAVKLKERHHGPDSRAELVQACLLLPELDTLVLARNIPSAGPYVWRSPAPRRIAQNGAEPVTVANFYIYDCGALRGGARLDAAG